MDLIEYDADTNTAVWHDYDHLTDTTFIHTVQDVEPILEANKRAMTDGTDGWSPTKELKKVACIPNTLIEKWLREEGINVYDNNHWPAVARKLNSNEYAFLRTGSGNLGGKIA